MTKLYFHDATSTVSGTLPTTQQGAYTAPNVTVDAYTVNRSMDTNIGTAQTSKSGSTTLSTKTIYYTKFVSPTLNQTSVAANTWNYAFAVLESTAAGNFPVNASGPVYVCIYIWRPSTGAKIATISDGNSSGSFVEPNANSTEKSMFSTFTGSAVSCAVGDVIIIEVYIASGNSSATGVTCTFYYDGTTETNNNNTTVSNHASYIETPETLSFGAAFTLNRAVYIEYEEV